MTREEILLAALANANGQNPVELAKQMQEFLDGEPKPQPKQSTDEPNVEGSMAPVQAALELSAAKKDDAPERNNRVWSEIEVEKVKILKSEGKNIAQIATAMSRSISSIQCALYKLENNYHIGRRKKAPE